MESVSSLFFARASSFSRSSPSPAKKADTFFPLRCHAIQSFDKCNVILYGRKICNAGDSKFILLDVKFLSRLQSLVCSVFVGGDTIVYQFNFVGRHTILEQNCLDRI